MPQSSKSAKDIFLQALDAAPSDRAALLDAACGPDSALRRQVEALLKVHDEPDSFLDRSRINVGISDEIPAAISPTVNESIIEQPGSQLGPYKLLQQVGEGGMGSVWMAEQHEPVRRRVALKLIKPGMDSRQVLARFEAERQALSMMDHPNIAKVLDAGTTEGGRPYFVMELVKGQPITQYCDERHLTPRERLELFLPLCHAIQHAHQKGIIHRDIKPSNVLVAEYDGRPVAKVIDFGVAKAVHQPLTEKTMFTGIGQIIGTLEYMSPEQARVNQLDIDTRSDVYSLGVLLYELLTGSTPFDKKRMREAALDELLRIIREEEPPRPSNKLSSSETMPSIAANRKTEPARLSMLVRGELDWIVMKALEKDRNRRYETANGFAMDIQRYLSDEAVLACPPSAGYRFRKFARKNKALLGATAAVAAALIIGLIGTAWQAIRAIRAEERAIAERDEKENARREAIASAEREAEQRQLAEAAEKRAVEEAATAKAVSDFLQEDLLGLAGAEEQIDAELEPDPDLKLSTLIDRALIKAKERFTGQPRVLAELEATIGVTLRKVGRYNESLTMCESVYHYYERTLGPDHPKTIARRSELALSYIDAGRTDIALPILEEILEQRTKALGANHTGALQSMHNLASAYLESGKFDAAVPLLEDAVASKSHLLGNDHESTLTSKAQLARAYLHSGKWQDSIAIGRATLATMGKTLGMAHPKTLACMALLAHAHEDAEQFNQALELHDRIVVLTKSALGTDHPSTLASMANLAMGYAKAGQVDKAIVALKESVEMQRVKLGPDHPAVLISMNNLGSCYLRSAQWEDAIEILEPSSELCKRKRGLDHPDTLTGLINLSLAYRKSGKPSKAIAVLEQILPLIRNKPHLEQSHLLESLTGLAWCYQESGQIDKAVPIFQEVHQLYAKIRGPADPMTLDSMTWLPFAYYFDGQDEKAIPLCEAALEKIRANLPRDHAVALNCLDLLISACHRAGENQKTLELLTEAVEYEHLLAPKDLSDRRTRARYLLLAADVLNQLQQWGQSDKYASEGLEIRREIEPEHWSYFNALSIHGESLLGLGKWDDSEYQLKTAYRGLREREHQIPNGHRFRVLKGSVQRLIRLYEAKEQPDEISYWNDVLQDLEASAARTSPQP